MAKKTKTKADEEVEYQEQRLERRLELLRIRKGKTFRETLESFSSSDIQKKIGG